VDETLILLDQQIYPATKSCKISLLKKNDDVLLQTNDTSIVFIFGKKKHCTRTNKRDSYFRKNTEEGLQIDTSPALKFNTVLIIPNFRDCLWFPFDVFWTHYLVQIYS
jgi:hypothetical protein